MHTSLSEFSAVELSALIKQRMISPLELVRHSIERAHKLQPTLNCFITICSERAIMEARLAEQALLKGESLGALHGVPFTVKDIVHTEAVVTSFGAVPLKDFVPSEDAVAVARLRGAGAILIGKTTTPEFGSKCLTDSPLFGKTANPWQLGRTSGGSSLVPRLRLLLVLPQLRLRPTGAAQPGFQPHVMAWSGSSKVLVLSRIVRRKTCFLIRLT